MGAAGLTSPIRNETYDNLQLNAGLFIKDFDYSDIADASALKDALATAILAGTNILGATRGGGTFNITREMREPEVDGKRYAFVGGRFVDSVDANLTTTLLEATPGNFVNALGSASATTSGKKTTVKMHTALADSDYLTNICWIGDIADGRLALICLYNALNTADFTFTFTDKGEGTYNVEFHAHQAEVLDYDYAPFEIVFFDKDSSATLASITVASAAGTNVGETALTLSAYTPGSGESYVYKVGTSGAAPSIDYLEVPDYTWTSWNGSSAINVGASANGKKITVASVNAAGKAVAAGNVVLVVKTT